jgi:hypothetical protein
MGVATTKRAGTTQFPKLYTTCANGSTPAQQDTTPHVVIN